jgi:hypothetical protein
MNRQTDELKVWQTQREPIWISRTDRQTNICTDKRTDRQTNICTDKRTDRQTDSWTD